MCNHYQSSCSNLTITIHLTLKNRFYTLNSCMPLIIIYRPPKTLQSYHKISVGTFSHFKKEYTNTRYRLLLIGLTTCTPIMGTTTEYRVSAAAANHACIPAIKMWRGKLRITKKMHVLIGPYYFTFDWPPSDSPVIPILHGSMSSLFVR